MRKKFAVLAGALAVLVAAPFVASGLANARSPTQVRELARGHSAAHGSTRAWLRHELRTELIATSRNKVNPSLRETFALLRRARTASTTPLPAPLSPDAVDRFGLNLGDAQFTETGSADVWVIPGTFGVCVMARYTIPSGSDAGGQQFTSCNTVDAVAQTGIGDSMAFRSVSPAGVVTQGGIVIVRLFPDGNATTTITDAAGVSESVPVVNNVAVAALPLSITTVSYKDADGVAESTTLTPDFPSPPELLALKAQSRTVRR